MAAAVRNLLRLLLHRPDRQWHWLLGHYDRWLRRVLRLLHAVCSGDNLATSFGWRLAPTLSLAQCGSGFAQSFGTGGIQVGLADGSTRTVAPSISIYSWNFAMQPNDGLPIGSDW